MFITGIINVGTDKQAILIVFMKQKPPLCIAFMSRTAGFKTGRKMIGKKVSPWNKSFLTH